MTNQERAAKANIARYNESKAYYLSDVYTKYSKAKEKAWTDCIRLMKGMNGRDFRIISHNSAVFTAGYLMTDIDTGVVKFVYLTPRNLTVVDYQ